MRSDFVLLPSTETRTPSVQVAAAVVARYQVTTYAIHGFCVRVKCLQPDGMTKLLMLRLSIGQYEAQRPFNDTLLLI